MTETFLGMTSTGWTAVTALATALLVLAGIATIATAISDSRNRSRPVLIPELEITKWGEGVDLTITNHGQCTAYNVQIRFSATYNSSAPPADSHAELYKENILKKYSHTIQAWGPGQRESNPWIWGREHGNGIRGLPSDDEVVTITYDRRSVLNALPGLQRRHKESFHLSMVKRMHDLTATSSRDLDQQMKEVIKELKRIAQR